MTNAHEYLGRKVDLVAFQGIGQTLDRLVLTEMNLAGKNDAGRLCTGLVALVQRVVKAFLTPQESVPFHPEEGCPLLNNLREGEITTQTDAVQSFAVSISDVMRQVVRSTPEDAPDDEQIDRIDLENVTLTGDEIHYMIRVTSLAGSVRQVVMPISASLVMT